MPETAIRESQPGWVLQSDQVELFVTQLGGHMAPVTFYRDTPQARQPYFISDWQNEGLEIDEPVLVPLRGDFFCMPFGANLDPYQGEKHVVHGETSSSKWNLISLTEDDGVRSLVLDIDTKVRQGHVTKKISLVNGQNVLYITHTIEGFAGKTPLGHHANLAVPETEGTLKVSVGQIDLGMTYPILFGNPANREYQSLAIGAEFSSLEEVPLIWKEPAVGDCSSFPQRTGHTDVLVVFKNPTSTPAWTTAVNTEEGYLWYAFKDAGQLPNTAFWIGNRGRHGAPWNGRNRVLGLEETCGYFAEGLAASVEPNRVNEKGFATHVTLSADSPTVIRMIQGVVNVPPNFDRVKEVSFQGGGATFTSESGVTVSTEVNTEFLQTGALDT